MRRMLVVATVLATVLVGVPRAEAKVTSATACPSVTDSVVRLFSAFFLRDPDEGGRVYWTERYTDGVLSLPGVATNFAASPEFRSRYGELTDAEFVDLVYENVLGRPADAGGKAFWVGKLESGTSRGSVMVGFSESPEYVANTGTAPPLSRTPFPAGTRFHCGAGSKVLPISQPAGGAVLRISMPGDGHRSIVSRGADLSYGDLLVNTTEPYLGDRIVGYSRAWIWPPAAHLEIDSDGPWVIAVAPLSFAPTSSGNVSGTGDAVIRMDRGPGVVHLTHSGASNFAIWAGRPGDADLVVNEIGTWSGERVVEVGPSYWQVDADGGWTIAFR